MSTRRGADYHPAAMLCHCDDVPWATHEHGDLRFQRQRLGAAAGARDIGLSRYRIAPGCQAMPLHVHADEEIAPLHRSSPRHCHSVEDELFVVLDGDGVLVLGDESHPVRVGSVIARPPATGVAHTFQAGEDGMALLAFGTREASDLCWYPDSGKVFFRGLKVVAGVQALDYWDGES